MGLPHLINAACTEMWNAANMAFALCPLLGFGAMINPDLVPAEPEENAAALAPEELEG